MIKRLNKDKRAQSSSPIAVLVAVVLGVIVLVIMAIVITQGFDVVLKALGLAPSNVAGMIEKCSIFGGQVTDVTSAHLTYCEVERKINTDRYGKINVNCNYPEISNEVNKDKINEQITDCNEIEKNFCIGQTQKNGNQVVNPITVKVNWYNCQDVFDNSIPVDNIIVPVTPPTVTGETCEAKAPNGLDGVWYTAKDFEGPGYKNCADLGGIDVTSQASDRTSHSGGTCCAVAPGNNNPLPTPKPAPTPNPSNGVLT